MANELRQSFALLPGGSDSWIWITEPVKSRIKKLMGGRSFSAAALSIKGPTKDKLRRTILFSSHSPEPMVNERRLPHPSPGNNCNKDDMLVCPRTIQESDIFLSTKSVAARHGQSGNGNLLRRKAC